MVLEVNLDKLKVPGGFHMGRESLVASCNSEVQTTSTRKIVLLLKIRSENEANLSGSTEVHTDVLSLS